MSSFDEWLKRQKHKIKRALGTGIPRSSLSSHPSNPSTTPTASPLPRITVTPVADALNQTTGPESSTRVPAVGTSYHTVETGTSAPSTVSLPNPLDHTQVDTTVTATPRSLPETLPGLEAAEKKMAWPGLKALLGVVNSGAEIFGPLKSAAEVLEQSIGNFERASKARGDYQRIGKRLDQLLGDLAQFNDKWAGEAMTTGVKSLCREIEAEIKFVGEKQARSGPERYMEAIEDEDAILECYRRIQEHVERLTLNANLTMWKTIDEEMTDRRLLQLYPLMSGYNSGAADKAKRRRCTEGTREAEHREDHDCIYTLGDLEETNELAASFFCTRLIPECRDTQLILPAIAYQLAQFSYPFRYALSQVIQSDPLAHTRELTSQFKKLIADPLKVVQRTLPSSFVVLIDALDECEDSDGVGKVLDLLVTCTSGLPIRFLVSSRPEPDIYRRMMKEVGGVPDARLVLHELDPNDVQQDIGAYIRSELKDIPLEDEQWTGLLARCGVLFVYAATVCRYIKCGNEMMEYKEAVDIVLGLSPEDTGDMEKDLDNLYTIVLKTAFDRPQISRKSRERMKTILDTIICAQEPMTTDAIAGLLQLSNADHARTLLRSLYSVVNVAEETGVATTLHASFPDYMLNPSRSTSFHCDAPKRHIELAQACLRQIKANPVQFNICGLESSYVLDREVADLSERAERAISPALSYACGHWVCHLELGGPSIDLSGPVLDFLSARLLLWMEVLNIKGGGHDRESSISRVESWCRKTGMIRESIELAHDARQFVSSNTGSLESTPHIYISMLAFWPSTSPVSKHYLPRATGLPQPHGTAITRRHRPRLAFRYMGEPMHSVCYSPDGTQIVVAVGNDIYILDGLTAQTIWGPLKGHTDLVTTLAVSPDGSYIASGSYDTTICLWNPKSGKLITGPIKAHRDRVTSVAFSPDGTSVVSTGAFDGVRIWSAQTGEHILTAISVNEHTPSIRTAIFSADGSQIISGYDNGISVWDAHTGSLISEHLGPHSAQITSLSLSFDDPRFVTASGDSSVCVWDSTSHQVVLGPLKRHVGEVYQAILSPNGLYVASCADDCTIHLWDVKDGGVATIFFEGDGVMFKSVAFSPDSSRLVSCSSNGDICIWNTLDTDRYDTLLRRYRGVHTACFSSNGSRIVTGGEDGTICLWDVNTGEPVIGPLIGHRGYVHSLAISPDGFYIGSASRDKSIRLWDLKGEQGAYIVLDHHTKGPDTLRFTDDNSHLCYGSLTYPVGNPFTSEVESAPDGDDVTDEWAEEFTFYKSYPAQPFAVQFSGKPGGEISYFTRFRSDEWEKLINYLLDNHGSYGFISNSDFSFRGLSCTARSPDGSYVASNSRPRNTELRHAETGHIFMPQQHTSPVSKILFSPNGSHLVTCSCDGTVRFWPIPRSLTVEGAGTNPTDCDAGTGLSTTADPSMSWSLNPDDGWILNDRNERLVYIPDDLKSYLLKPKNDLLLSARGSFRMDFIGANIGKAWTKCYQPAE